MPPLVFIALSRETTLAGGDQNLEPAEMSSSGSNLEGALKEENR